MSRPSLQLRRSLRSNSTDAERRLWRFLRAGRIGVLSLLADSRRQHSFGHFIVDFYCAAARLVVELDGSQHYESEYENYDARRTRVLEALGLRVIRFTNVEVLRSSDLVLETIVRAVGHPLPSPLPRRERGPES